MESVVHSWQPNKVAVILSKQTNNDGGLSGKSLYDDVYGGPPKFGVANLSPRFEDYSEIFGSFHAPRASSIPVLDLPVVDETEVFFDPRSPAFNYTEVFGAFSGVDFAVSFDDLFHQSNGLDDVSSEEAWTPEETDSLSGESGHFGNNQGISDGDLFHSVGGNTELNISFHKATGTRNEDMSKGKTHMTQLHAVPGYTIVCDETALSHRTDQSFYVADDIDLDMEFNADNVKGNHLRKTMSHQCNFASGEQTVDSDLNLHNGLSINGSHSSEMFLTVADINLRSMPSHVPPPSWPPPVLDAKKGNSYGFHSNCGQVASEETTGDGFPLFFDVEVDVNSSAAASATAIKEVMHRAGAKLRSCKELKERKKGVSESCVRSSYDMKGNEQELSENGTKLNSLNDAAMQVICDKRYTKTKVSLIDERKKARKATPGTLDSLEGKGTFNMFEEKNLMECMSSQELDRSTGVGTWKEETEFFDLVRTDESGQMIQLTKHANSVVQDIRIHESGWKEREASNMQEEYRKVQAIEENCRVDEDKKKKAAQEAYKNYKNIRRSKPSNVEREQREPVKKERVAETEIFEQGESQKNIIKAHQCGKTEKIVSETDQSRSVKDMSQMRHEKYKPVEFEKSKKVDKQAPGEAPSFAIGQVECKEKLRDSVKIEDFDKRSNGAFGQDHSKEKEACTGENETRLKQDKQIQNKKRLKEAHEEERTEKGLKGYLEKEGSHEGLKLAVGLEENEKRLQEGFELQVNECRLKDAHEIDQNKKEYEKFSDGYGEGNRLQEASDNKGVQKVLNQATEKERNGRMLNEGQSEIYIESPSKQAFGSEGEANLSNEDSQLDQSGNMVKDADRKGKDIGLNKTLDQMEGNEGGENMTFAKATDVTWELERDENLPAAQSASIHEQNIVKLEVTQEFLADQEIGKTRTVIKAGEKKLEERGVENLVANEKIRVPEMIIGDAGHSGTQSRKVDDSATKADDRRSKQAAEAPTEQEAVKVQNTSGWFHVGQCTERKEKSFNETAATIVKDAERMRREQELEKDHLRKMEEEREREKDIMAVDKAMLEAEREREREKDRITVERATFEVRDRACGEACERAERDAFERATLEAQQKALSKAGERCEKACAEARDKSYADKATTEATLKAERAAVERATAEAQQRAMEKLKAEKAAFESRDRLERSVSDKFGVFYRNGSSSSDMLDPQFQNLSSPAGSRYLYQSVYGASSFSGRSEREGESAQRCRARLERYRRTAERVAKALAEKNMRDLQAQKEQAERNRLAETLDAEVRRWSSGKEGNLRALLSTLQYILGPDSGWLPIPLTEVITSAAVKKAYRKATLCVHPDKLQQRGASISHKYICEKVFDLLKEAWNKFNSEER